MKSTNQKAIVHGSGLLEGKREKRKGDKKEKNKRGEKKRAQSINEAEVP